MPAPELPPPPPASNALGVPLGRYRVSAWVLPVAYASGFVVVNAHLGRYFPTDFDLFHAQYLAAAILFALGTILFLVLGYWVGREYFRDSFVQFRRRIPRILHPVVAALYIPLACGAPGFLVWHLNNIISLDGDLAFVGYSVSMMILAAIATILSHPDHPLVVWRLMQGREPAGFNAVMGLFGTIIICLSLATVFGVGVYPSVRPQFGGGGAWTASLVRRDHSFAGDTVLLIGAASEGPRVLRCSGGEVPTLVPLLFTGTDVDFLVLYEAISVGEFERRCIMRGRRPEEGEGETSRE